MTSRFFSSRAEAIYWTIAISMLAAFAVSLTIMIFDARTIDGHSSVWTKPLKFELSLALHAATLGLVCRLLSQSHRQGTAMLLIAAAFSTACAAEMSYIIMQGARGEQSHFNVGTPFHRFMYSVMAFAAVIITGAAAAIALVLLADRHGSASAAMKTAIALGLVGGTVLTLITGFTIGARMSPYVGGVPAFDARMLFTGWSLTTGDLRVSHFLATHMTQVVPFIGLVVDHILPGRIAVRAMLAVAAVWTVVTLEEYRVALAGKPSILAVAIR